MFNLPTELQYLCLETLNVEALRSFRLVNKAALALSIELLFRTVSVTNKDESASNYTKILEHPKLRPLVRRVIFNTSDDPNYSERYGRSDFLDSFADAIRDVTRFPNLREVELKFATICVDRFMYAYWHVPEPIEFRENVLVTFFSALKDAVKVESLTIKNLQDATPKAIYESDDFKSVRGRLKKLALQITTETDIRSTQSHVDNDGCHQGFRHDLPKQWLNPLHTQLTHLSIWATHCHWGIWPFVDLRQVPTFTCLKSLSLGQFTIAHEWQLDWIVSHAQTLEELYLDDCPIIPCLYICEEEEEEVKEQMLVNFRGAKEQKTGDGYVKQVDIRWHQVFARFQATLSHLTHFAIGTIGDGAWGRRSAFEERYELVNQLLEDRYLVFEDGIQCGPDHWHRDDSSETGMYDFNGLDVQLPDKECDRRDMAALGELMKVVERRGAMKV